MRQVFPFLPHFANSFLRFTIIASILVAAQSISGAVQLSNTIAAPIQDKLVQNEQAKKVYSQQEVDKAWENQSFNFPQDWNSVTDELEAEKWGRQFERLIAEQKQDEAAAMIDMKPLIDRGLDGLESKGFRLGFSSGAAGTGSKWVAAFAEPACSYTYLRVVPTEFGAGVLMRMYRGDSASNYYIWRLQKNDKKEIVAVDTYVLLTGEAFSDTLRRIAILSYPKEEGTIMGQLFGTDKMLTEHQNKMLEMFAHQQRGNLQGVLDAYNELPTKLQREKFLMLVRVQAAMKLDEKLYVEALSDLKRFHNGDVSVDFTSYDYLVVEKKYPEALAALDRITEFLGENGHLCSLRAAVFINQGETEKAVEQLKKSLEIEPQFETAYWVLIGIHLEQQDFKAVNAVLKSLVKVYQYDHFDFSSDPDYADYMKSPEHKEFLEFLNDFYK